MRLLELRIRIITGSYTLPIPLREGGFIADYEKVAVLCKNAPNVINELVGWGARFHREEDGRLTQCFLAPIHIGELVSTEIGQERK